MASKASKQSKKAGRNETSCKYYKLTCRREKNKVKKILRHLKKFGEDAVALQALKIAKAIV